MPDLLAARSQMAVSLTRVPAEAAGWTPSGG
jgi:hypothetical protein